ncbi:MAG: sigma-70 family RNA polymerase sigma factor [Eubacteriales bacterium]|nr:sigma-70 family RNA polymerase sigma factor [Eubacteriales bacterium]
MFLVRKARKHDKDAFVLLMKECGPDMYKVAKAILRNDDDAADAMQETALTCWDKIGTLKNDRYFKTWMTRILINHCNAILRERKRFVEGEELLENRGCPGEYSSVEWKAFLEEVEEKYRIILILYYVQGFKTREIAEILGIHESTVRGRLSTARSRIERMYCEQT